MDHCHDIAAFPIGARDAQSNSRVSPAALIYNSFVAIPVTSEAEGVPAPNEKNRPVLVAIITAASAIAVALIGYLVPRQSLINFTGTVRDSMTHRPIADARVSIEVDQNVPQRLTTDSEGIFYARLSKNAQSILLNVEADGYNRYRLEVPSVRTGIETILLEPNQPAPPKQDAGKIVPDNSKSGLIVKPPKEAKVQVSLADSGAGLVGIWRGQNGKPFFVHGYDAVAIPDRLGFDLPNGSPWTLEAWIHPTGDPGGHVVGKRDGCTGGDGFYQISIDANAPNTGMSVDPQYTPPYTWTHVAIVANGSDGWTSYANGTRVKTVSSPGWRVQNSGRFLIGGSGTCKPFIGAIDLVSLYARALSASEIQTAYSSQRSEVLHNRIEN